MNIWFRKTSVVIIALFLSVCSYAQNASKKMPGLDFVLSDTLNPDLHLIPIFVKLKSSDSTWITYTSAYTLYTYCEEQFSWNRKLFNEKIRNIILQDKFLVVDTAFMSNEKRIPKDECDCIYNEDNKHLIERLKAHNYYKYPDNRFICFLYKCLKNNIVIGYIEGMLVWRTSFTSE